MQRPWISTNLAVSADGKISSTHHQPSGWTSREDHSRLLELRQGTEALMVGRGTLESDQMTMASSRNPQPPLRCIVSSTGKISPEHPVFQSPGGEIHLLLTEPRGPLDSHPLRKHAQLHHNTLAGFLHTLATDHGLKHLHCEGGGSLIRSLAELDAIDEFHLTLAGHTLFGGGSAPTLTGIPNRFLQKSLDFEITHFDARNDSGECFLSYRRCKNTPPPQWAGA